MDSPSGAGTFFRVEVAKKISTEGGNFFCPPLGAPQPGYLFIVGRGMTMSLQCRDAFSRLLAGSIALTFFVYAFVNAGMVMGLLPVVGVPLPLVSYGGTSFVTLMAGFGILMALHSSRKLVG